jgi:hypothetical protein
MTDSDLPVDPRSVDADARRRALRAQKARAAVRRVRVAELRIAGASFRQVANEVGVSIHQVEMDWRRWCRELGPVEGVEEYRRVQQARYEERILTLRTLRQRAASFQNVNITEVARLIAVEAECEAGLRRLLGTDTPVAPVMTPAETPVGPELTDDLVITEADREEAARILIMEAETRKLLLPAPNAMVAERTGTAPADERSDEPVGGPEA